MRTSVRLALPLALVALIPSLIGIYAVAKQNAEARDFTVLVCKNVEHLKTLRRVPVNEEIARLETLLRASPLDAIIMAELNTAKRELQLLAATKC